MRIDLEIEEIVVDHLPPPFASREQLEESLVRELVRLFETSDPETLNRGFAVPSLRVLEPTELGRGRSEDLGRRVAGIVHRSVTQFPNE